MLSLLLTVAALSIVGPARPTLVNHTISGRVTDSTGAGLASAGGLWASFHFDLPAGPVVVCAFGVLLLAAFGLRRVMGANAG